MPGSRAGSVPVQDKDQQRECAEQITSEIKWCGLSHPPHFWDSSSPAEQAAARGRLCSLEQAVAACCRLESHADEAGPFFSGSSFSLVRPRPVACPDGLNDSHSPRPLHAADHAAAEQSPRYMPSAEPLH